MQTIPFRDFPQFTEQVQLTGNPFVFRLTWNALNEYWYMDMFDIDLNPLVLGIKIVNQYDLTYQFRAAITASGIPFGDIACIDFTNSFDKITRNQMGNSADLFYFEPGET